jgi:hypothetical protein
VNALDPRRTVQRSETLAAVPMGDELAMMDLDTGNYVVLNRIAAAIWEEIGEPVAIGDLVGRMRTRFEVAPERCEADVLRFIGELEAKGLVSVGEA